MPGSAMYEGPQAQLDTRALEVAVRAEQIARDAHDQCSRDYQMLRGDFTTLRAESSGRFDRQDADRYRMHGENQSKLNDNQVKLDHLSRIIYTAIGIAIAGSALLTAFGSPLLTRFFHG